MANDAEPNVRNGTAKAAEEAASLVNLAIRRTRGNAFVGEEVKELVCGPLEEAQREILLIADQRGRVGEGLHRSGIGSPGSRHGAPRRERGEGLSGKGERSADEDGATANGKRGGLPAG